MFNPFLIAFERGDNEAAVSTNGASFASSMLPQDHSYSSIGSGNGNYLVNTFNSSFPLSTSSFSFTNNSWTASTMPKPQDNTLCAVSPDGYLSSLYDDGRTTLTQTQVDQVNPTVGIDSDSGQTKMLITQGGKAKVAGYEQCYATGFSDQWTETEITQVYGIDGVIYATGSGKRSETGTKTLQWTYTGTLSPYQRTNTPSSTESLNYFNSKYLMATGSNIVNLDPSSITKVGPVTGLSAQTPTEHNTSNSSVSTTSLNANSSIIVGASTTYNGVWVTSNITTNGTWPHYVGEVVKVPSGHHSTSYTFPGYSGANPQIQIAIAEPPGDNQTPPSKWDANATPTLSSGYYGLVGCPYLKVVRDSDLVDAMKSEHK